MSRDVLLNQWTVAAAISLAVLVWSAVAMRSHTERRSSSTPLVAAMVLLTLAALWLGLLIGELL